MQRAQTSKIGKALGPIEIQDRKGQLKGDVDTDEKADDAPEGGGDHTVADHTVEILPLQRSSRGNRLISMAESVEKKPTSHEHYDNRMHLVGQIPRVIGRDHREKRDQTKRY